MTMKSKFSTTFQRGLAFALCGAISGMTFGAGMQIPNPLLKPPPAKESTADGQGAPNGVHGTGDLPMPPGTNRGRRDAPPPSQQGYGQGFGAPNGSGAPDNTPSTFREAKEKLAGFYVSAVVGNRATLRRNATIGGVPGNGQPGQPGQPVQPVFNPLYGGIAQGVGTGASSGATVQAETMSVTDGEAIDFIGDGVTLTPRVTSNRVYIYFSDDNTAGDRKPGRKQVVFVGQVESGKSPAPVAIVLEKRDANYKQLITVTTGAGAGSGSSTATSSPGMPPPPPATN